MHICFITDNYPQLQGGPTGGIGVFVQTLGHMLVQHGVQVSVVGAGYKNAMVETDEGVNVIRIGRSRWPKFKFLQQVLWLNRSLKRLHAASPISILECSEVGHDLITDLPNVKRVIRMHGGHHFFIHAQGMMLNKNTVWMEKKSFQKADALAAVSKYVNEETAKYLQFNPKETTIIYNGVLPKKIIEAAGNKTSEKNKIVFVGTVCEKKGARQLIQAFPEIKNSIPNAQLFMVGPDWKFPNGDSYIHFLQQYISEENKSSIQFIGAIPNVDIPAMLQSAQVCVFPSHAEALPMAWLEAMAMGKPVVASVLGPGTEIITHEKDGLLCNPLEPKDIAKNIIKILRDENLANELGIAAKKTVQEKFNMEKLVLENIEFYKKIISNN